VIIPRLSPRDRIDYSAYPPKNVVVAGATGLVGREIVKALNERPNAKTTALVRRVGALGALGGRALEVAFDYDDPEHICRIGGEIPCDVLLCALGTTIKTAGSAEAFRMVDLEYPSRLFRRLAELPNRPMVGVVSSIGAGKPRGLYLRTKADMEGRLIESGLPHLIARPSLLLGARDKKRPGELALAILLKPCRAMLEVFAPQSRTLWRYAPIEASKVAAAMVKICVDEPPTESGRVLEGLALHHPIMQ
jgi:uncharacterized protein YbjT (DUF2867 family)